MNSLCLFPICMPYTCTSTELRVLKLMKSNILYGVLRFFFIQIYKQDDKHLGPVVKNNDIVSLRFVKISKHEYYRYAVQLFLSIKCEKPLLCKGFSHILSTKITVYLLM